MRRQPLVWHVHAGRLLEGLGGAAMDALVSPGGTHSWRALACRRLTALLLCRVWLALGEVLEKRTTRLPPECRVAAGRPAKR